MNGPRVLLLDGDSFISLSIAKELSEDLNATVVGVGTNRYSRLLRSKYCDRGALAPATDDDGYVDAVLELVETHRPDVLLPVGYDSISRIEAARTELPAFVSHCLPPRDAFRVAIDKVSTSRYAERVGIDAPEDYSERVEAFDAAGRPEGCLVELDFPVFVKPRWEVDDNHVTTARVADPASFWEAYDRAKAGAPRGAVLVQEAIEGSGSTYGCALLFLDNDVELLFGHEELRSVPRRGGSGTRVRIRRDPYLEAKSIRLLREIGWHGIALVEYKRRADGSYALMEINPKFWATYALASSSGYRFASTAVARTLGYAPDRPFGSPAQVGEMAFPLRELHFYAKHRRNESLFECLTGVVGSGVSWSVDWTDARAWFTPPVGVVKRLPFGDAPSPDRARGGASGNGSAEETRYR